MPTWKKVVVSGSAISQLTNDANYLAAAFSASIDTRIDTLEAGGDLSGSAHIRRGQLSGSAATALRSEYVAGDTALSGSAHAQRVIEKNIAAGLVTGLANGAVATNASNISALSGSAHTNVISKISVISASAHTQRGAISASLNSAIAGLGSDYATDVELGNVSSSFVTTQAALSSSAHTDRIAKVNVLSGSAHSQRVIEKNIAAGLVTGLSNGAVAANATSITNLSGSSAAALRTEYVAGDTALSSSAHAQRVIEKNIASGLVTGLANGAVATNATSITNLSGSSAAAIRSEYVASTLALSGSGHIRRNQISASLAASIAANDGDFATVTALNTVSASVKDFATAAVAASIDAAPEALNTLNELAAALGDDGNFSASLHTATALRVKTTTFNTYSGSSASAIRSEYVAGDTALSGSAHAQRVIEKNIAAGLVTGLANGAVATNATSITNLSGSSASALRAERVAGDSALSGSAHGQRVVEKNIAAGLVTALSNGAVATNATSITNLSSSAATAGRTELTAISASAHTARSSGATSGSSHTQRVALIATLSGSAAAANNSSAITVRNLTGQAVVASSFQGDGSNLSNITVDQNATVSSTYSNVTTHAVTHNFGTKNVIVQIYDNNDQVLIPASITSTSTNVSTVTFDGSSSGTVVIARGGHVVSGSIPYANLINTPSASFSSRIDNLSGSGHADRLAKVNVLSGSAHTDRVARVNVLSGSAHTNVINKISVISASLASTIAANDGDFATVTAVNTISASVKDYADAAVAASIDAAPAALDTLNELAAALGDDGNFSASLHTATSLRVKTTTFNTYSGSSASALRTEYVAGDTALSGSAHAQRVIEKNIAAGLVTGLSNGAVATNATSITNLSGSSATAMRAERVAGDSALSGSSHAQRVIEKNIAAGLVTALSNGAVAANATSITNLSGSSAAALRTEYKAGDTALSSSLNTRIVSLEGAGTVASLSGSAHAQRVIEKNIASGLVSSLSGSAHTDRIAKVSTLSGSAHTNVISKISVLSASIANNDPGFATVSAVNTVSASVKDYADAAVAASIDAAPEALNTLNELAAALGDDGNFSASLHTATSLRVKTTTFNTYSGSAAAAIRSEYVAGDSALSGSAHSQRVIEKNIAAGLVTGLANGAVATNATSITNLSGSSAAAIRSEYVAGDTALSSSLNTRIVSLEGAGTVSALSGSSATAMRAERVAGDSALSGSSHAQRVIEKNIAAGLVTALSNGAVATNATSITNLSGSSATALRAERVAGDSALSGSSHAQRVIEKNIAAGLVTALSNGAVASNATAITNLSGSSAAALRAEYAAADTALSSSQNTYINAKVAGITSDFTISDGSSTDSFTTGQTLTFAGTSNEIETSVSNNQVAIGIVTNPTLSGNVTVTGNLIVTGDTIEQQVTNLNVEDKFILINSGSTAGDSGIIFGGSGGTANTGTALFFDDSADVLALGTGVAFGATTAAVAAKVGTITESTAVPTAAPTYQGVGSMHVKTDSQDIYIYTAD